MTCGNLPPEVAAFSFPGVGWEISLGPRRWNCVVQVENDAPEKGSATENRESRFASSSNSRRCSFGRRLKADEKQRTGMPGTLGSDKGNDGRCGPLLHSGSTRAYSQLCAKCRFGEAVVASVVPCDTKVMPAVTAGHTAASAPEVVVDGQHLRS